MKRIALISAAAGLTAVGSAVFAVAYTSNVNSDEEASLYIGGHLGVKLGTSEEDRPEVAEYCFNQRDDWAQTLEEALEPMRSYQSMALNYLDMAGRYPMSPEREAWLDQAQELADIAKSYEDRARFANDRIDFFNRMIERIQGKVSVESIVSTIQKELKQSPKPDDTVMLGD
ncbi:MAG: hypothetical protein AAGH88_11135 [Planctomycetota bacterium]